MAFDPSNRDHRRYYAEFVKYGGWGKCPVRFVVPEDCGSDLPTMIKNQLLDWYVGKEFKDRDLFKQPARRKLVGIGAGGWGIVAEKPQKSRSKKTS